MFRPSLICQLRSKTGRNLRAEETYADPIDIGYSPVMIERMAQKTSVRSDSSASRGQADELVVKTKILVDKAVTIAIDDMLTIDGNDYRVSLIHSRRNVWGRLDHFEVDMVPAP